MLKQRPNANRRVWARNKAGNIMKRFPEVQQYEVARAG